MKKWLEILLYGILGIVLIIGGAIGYFYYQFEGKYKINSEKYQNYIGYLSPENRDFSPKFKPCNSNLPNGYYSNIGFETFDKSKSSFKQFIESNFKKERYTDSGMLNLRFIINCKGEIGDMEVNQLNKDYQLTELNSDLVEKIIQLTVEKENWTISNNESHDDKYMYLIFRLEDVKIVEILP